VSPFSSYLCFRQTDRWTDKHNSQHTVLHFPAILPFIKINIFSLLKELNINTEEDNAQELTKKTQIFKTGNKLT
jgi:hypothetical protein